MRSRTSLAVAVAAACRIGVAAQGSPVIPITVEQAVNEAIERNANLLADRFNVAVADAAVLTASLRPNPVVTANLMRPDQSLVDAGISPYEQVFRTDYVLERGGKRERRVDQATLARSVTELQLSNTTRTLLLDVAERLRRRAARATRARAR